MWKFGTLANYLNNQNHDVTVVDNRPEAFNNLELIYRSNIVRMWL